MSVERVGVGVIGAGVISRGVPGEPHELPRPRGAVRRRHRRGARRAQAEKYGVPGFGSVRAAARRRRDRDRGQPHHPGGRTSRSPQQALAAGKHVWSEKPFALDRESGLELLRPPTRHGPARRHARRTRSSAPGIQTARRMVEGGGIGTPLTALDPDAVARPGVVAPEPGLPVPGGRRPAVRHRPVLPDGARAAVRAGRARGGASASKARETRVIGSGPRAGEEFAVTVPTHVSALYEFESGQTAQSDLQLRLAARRARQFEVTGTDATLVVPDPNTFDGRVSVVHGPDEDRDGSGHRLHDDARHRRGRAGARDPRRRAGAGVRRAGLPRARHHGLDHRGRRVAGHPVDVESTVAVAPALPEDWDPRAATLWAPTRHERLSAALEHDRHASARPEPASAWRSSAAASWPRCTRGLPARPAPNSPASSSSSPETSARRAPRRSASAERYDSLDEIARRRHHRRGPRLHAERAARRAGRRGARRRQARRLREAAGHHGRGCRGAGRPPRRPARATVPFVYRFHPMVREARARFALGRRPGAVLSINASYLQDWLLGVGRRQLAGRRGAGRAVARVRRHRLAPGRPRRVRQRRPGRRASRATDAHGVRRACVATRGITTEDAVAVVIETRSGAIGTLLVSQVAPGRKNRLLPGDRRQRRERRLRPGAARDAVGRAARAGSLLIPRDADQLSADAARLCVVPSGHPQGYQDAFNAFVADSYAAVAGREPGRAAAVRGRPARRPGHGRGDRLGRVRHLDRDGSERMTDSTGTRSRDARTRSPCSPASGPTSRSRRSRKYASEWGYDGLEIACSGDHLDVWRRRRTTPTCRAASTSSTGTA